MPEYGITEVADHGLALALALRRDIALHRHGGRAPGQGAPAVTWRRLAAARGGGMAT